MSTCSRGIQNPLSQVNSCVLDRIPRAHLKMAIGQYSDDGDDGDDGGDGDVNIGGDGDDDIYNTCLE